MQRVPGFASPLRTVWDAESDVANVTARAAGSGMATESSPHCPIWPVQFLFVEDFNCSREAGPLNGVVIQIGLDVVRIGGLEEIAGVRDPRPDIDHVRASLTEDNQRTAGAECSFVDLVQGHGDSIAGCGERDGVLARGSSDKQSRLARIEGID